jgi:hypothetical protein
MINKILFLIIFLLFIICIKKYFLLENFIEITKIPKNIYVYLDNVLISQLHIKALKLNAKNEWNIIVLTNDNIANYIENKNLKKYTKLVIDKTDPKNIKKANINKKFIDLVCLDILYNKGGIFIDSSIIIYSPKQLINYINEIYLKEYDSSLIQFDQTKEPNKNKYNEFIKSWIYIAPKNSIFIKRLHTMLYKNYILDFEKYIKINKINDKKILLFPLKLQAYYIHNNSMTALLDDGYMFKVNKRLEQSKKIYGINITKAHKKIQTGNYIYLYNRFIPVKYLT